MPEPTDTEKFDELMSSMSKTREKWIEDGSDEDDTDRLLSNAIELAIEQGRGWAPGAKEAYLEQILDDDFIPPLFCANETELEQTGLKDAFSSLKYEGETPTSLMLQFKQKGAASFADGKRNEVGNLQYFRDAVNHYYEAYACACHIEAMHEGDLAQADTDEDTYTPQQLDELKSTLCGNIALMHMQLKNWGHARDECKKALDYSRTNVKAWYRLAKCYQHLQLWEEAGDAIDSGLNVETDDGKKDLQKLQVQLAERVRRARLVRQQRERARAERVKRVKEVWKYCKEQSIRLGRVPLVSTVTDDEEEDDDRVESRWHHHLPNTGELPTKSAGEWSWPCMFLYPSHKQSDFVKAFAESDMLALQMAEMFPEMDNGETNLPWDYNNEFSCSNLAVYFEIHDTNGDKGVVHPDNVELLNDQAACMRFYESSRALKGDEGPEMANVVRAVERKHLHKQRKEWKKQHGSLWAMPDPNKVVRVHPAMTLREILRDTRMVVPNVSCDELSLSPSSYTLSLTLSTVPRDLCTHSREPPGTRGVSERTQLRGYPRAERHTIAISLSRIQVYTGIEG